MDINKYQQKLYWYNLFISLNIFNRIKFINPSISNVTNQSNTFTIILNFLRTSNNYIKNNNIILKLLLIFPKWNETGRWLAGPGAQWAVKLRDSYYISKAYKIICRIHLSNFNFILPIQTESQSIKETYTRSKYHCWRLFPSREGRS